MDAVLSAMRFLHHRWRRNEPQTFKCVMCRYRGGFTIIAYNLLSVASNYLLPSRDY